jgi:hypothetical protein
LTSSIAIKCNFLNPVDNLGVNTNYLNEATNRAPAGFQRSPDAVLYKENLMQTNCWRLLILMALFELFTLSGPPAHAAALQSGIHGMAWGSHATNYPYLEKVREEGAVAYYIDRNIVYHSVGQPVSGVVYGFYRDQLFAAYIKLTSPNQAYYLEKHFNVEYGPARVKAVGSGAQTIYRWGSDDLKIKLKINEPGNDIKLGIYYAPLSTELNQTQAEDGPSDGLGQPPSGDKAAKSAPLL